MDDDHVPTSAYINRELSWLAFNRRVLSEAANTDNPVLERLRFLSITASNLDEFFMVRFASLRYRMLRGDKTVDAAGLTPGQQVRQIDADARRFMDEQIAVLAGLGPALAELGLRMRRVSTLNADQRRWIENCMRQQILPRVELYIQGRKEPVPHVTGRRLYIGLLLEKEKKGGRVLAVAPMPVGLPRLWRLPAALGDGFVYIEDIVCTFAALLTPGHRVLGCYPFRATRDEDYTVPEDTDTVDDLVAETHKSLSKRKTGAIVRMEVDAGASPEFLTLMTAVLGVRREVVYRIDGPLALTALARELCGLPDMDAGRYPPRTGRMPDALRDDITIFRALRAGDILLHHPYDSFDAVLRLVREAATDPRVLAINMTLYRVSGNSPVIRALCEAAESGKRVTVLLELKARFDEENNIHWAEVLDRAGCDVIYGLPRLKTHSKILLIVRREGDGLRRYMHLGTGNYNDVTARQYTDMGLMTGDPALGEDAQAFFNMITGFSREPVMHRLIYAPRMLRQSLTALIENEITNAKAGRPCGISAKMNSLVDPGIIRLLYDASAAGVPVFLVVRGVCCLRAGVPGLSEGIQVRSIVGRFLEHSRVFRFENGGEARLFLSSADWMPRNLNRRIELMFPIIDEAVAARINQVLTLQWQDNVKAWKMLPDGTYTRVAREEPAVNAQELLFDIGGKE